MGEDATAFLDAYMALLPEEMPGPVERLIGGLGRYAGSQERPWAPSVLKPKEPTAPDER